MLNFLKKTIKYIYFLFIKYYSRHKYSKKIKLIHSTLKTVGQIDVDGRLLTDRENISFFTKVDSNNFILNNNKIKVSICQLDNDLIIKKSFGNNQFKFYHEFFLTNLLSSTILVPKIIGINYDELIIYKQLIKGDTIRNILVSNGANILINQTKNDPELIGLDELSKIEAVWKRGNKNIKKHFSKSIIENININVDKMHKMGVCKLSLTYGNIIIDKNNDPWFIDFENSLFIPQFLKPFVNYYKNIDVKNFKKLYL